MVYNIHNGLFTHYVYSQRLIIAERILLTDNLHFMITVEMEQVIIWRLEPVTGQELDTEHNDVKDAAAAGETFYDDFDDDKRQDISKQPVCIVCGALRPSLLSFGVSRTASISLCMVALCYIR